MKLSKRLSVEQLLMLVTANLGVMTIAIATGVMTVNLGNDSM